MVAVLLIPMLSSRRASTFEPFLGHGRLDFAEMEHWPDCRSIGGYDSVTLLMPEDARLLVLSGASSIVDQ